MTKNIIRCDRCRKRCRNADGWNVVASQGAITGYLCPDCQTPEENAEAAVREATLDYYRDEQGQYRTKPKVDR